MSVYQTRMIWSSQKELVVSNLSPLLLFWGSAKIYWWHGKDSSRSGITLHSSPLCLSTTLHFVHVLVQSFISDQEVYLKVCELSLGAPKQYNSFILA